MHYWLPEISLAQEVPPSSTGDFQPAAKFSFHHAIAAILPGAPAIPTTPSPDFSH
jgi:hypothetical protein